MPPRKSEDRQDEAKVEGEPRRGASGETAPVSPFDPRNPPHPEKAPRAVEHIPWSYGQDRVTGIVIDPGRLFVYWEIGDLAIERARAGLGGAGRDAWLCLRIYDVTGRDFDGTNAVSYFDIRVEREHRQWFVEVGKPASSGVVELGMKSLEGYFVQMVRSGQVEFPRATPAPGGAARWLTVRAEGGQASPRILRLEWS